MLLQMTGFSGAGKTTIAILVAQRLREEGLAVEVIDGDVYRLNLCSDLGFTKEARNENIRRLGFVGQLLARNNIIAILAAINPYEDIRNEIGGDKVFINCSIDKAIERDTKGLYAKALKGEIKGFTGISDPFELPVDPDIVINTDKETVSESVEKLYSYIMERTAK